MTHSYFAPPCSLLTGSIGHRLCVGKNCKKSLEPWDYAHPLIKYCFLCSKKKAQNIYSVAEGVESIWNTRQVQTPIGTQKQYLVKYKNIAHIYDRWLSESELPEEASSLIAQMNERSEDERWRQEWSVPHRLLQKRSVNQHEGNDVDAHHEWLVKWCGLGYEHSTWESDTVHFLNSAEGQSLIHDYENSHPIQDAAEYSSSSNDFGGDTVTTKEKLGKFVSNTRTEYWVPVQISDIQLEQYCYTLVSRSSELQSNAKKEFFHEILANTIISLRQCCDHPYLLDPALEYLINKDLKETESREVEIKASGKLQLLDAMLLEIKNQGLKAVVFYQAIGGAKVETGNILDDFMRYKFGSESYERLEGDILPSNETSAINNFNKKGSPFVLLLETRACKSSIMLETVDVFIIFNSNLRPAYDLKVLQKIKLGSKFENTKVFRLYSAGSVEEKTLILAKKSKFVERYLKNLSWGTMQSMLMWGASELFIKLDRFHHMKKASKSDQSHLKDVMSEVKTILSEKNDPTNKFSSVIKTKYDQIIYCKESEIVGEQNVKLIDEIPPKKFWEKLFERKTPKWKYISSSSPRNRKRVEYCKDPLNFWLGTDDEKAKKRKKVVGDNDDISPCRDGKLNNGIEKEGAMDSKAHFAPWNLPTKASCIEGTTHDKGACILNTLGDSSFTLAIDALPDLSTPRRLPDSHESLHIHLKDDISFAEKRKKVVGDNDDISPCRDGKLNNGIDKEGAMDSKAHFAPGNLPTKASCIEGTTHDKGACILNTLGDSSFTLAIDALPDLSTPRRLPDSHESLHIHLKDDISFEEKRKKVVGDNDDISPCRDGKLNNGIDKEGAMDSKAHFAPGNLPTKASCIEGTTHDKGACILNTLGDSSFTLAIDALPDLSTPRKLPDSHESLHIHLKDDITKLCEVLKLSKVTTEMAQKFMVYAMKHYAKEESANKSQAFQISICLIASSLLKNKLCSKQSVALAKEYLGYRCTRHEVDYFYSMLWCLKSLFLVHTGNVKLEVSLEGAEELNKTINKDIKPAKTAVNKLNANMGFENLLPSQECSTTLIVQGSDVSNKAQLLMNDLSESITEVESICHKKIKKLMKRHEDEIKSLLVKYDEEKVTLENSNGIEASAVTLHISKHKNVGKHEQLDSAYSKKLEDLKHTMDIHVKDLRAVHLKEKTSMLQKKNLWVRQLRSWALDMKSNLCPKVHGAETFENVVVDTKENSFVIPPGQTHNENAALDTRDSEGAKVAGFDDCSGASSPFDADKKVVPTNNIIVKHDIVRAMSLGVTESDALGTVASDSSPGSALQVSRPQLQMINEVSKPSRETPTASGTTRLTEAAKNTLASTSCLSKNNVPTFVPDVDFLSTAPKMGGSENVLGNEISVNPPVSDAEVPPSDIICMPTSAFKTDRRSIPTVEKEIHNPQSDVELSVKDPPPEGNISISKTVPPLPSNAIPSCDDFPPATECIQLINKDLIANQIAGTSTQGVEPIVAPPASIAGHAPVTRSLSDNQNSETATQAASTLSLYLDPFIYDFGLHIAETSTQLFDPLVAHRASIAGHAPATSSLSNNQNLQTPTLEASLDPFAHEMRRILNELSHASNAHSDSKKVLMSAYHEEMYQLMTKYKTKLKEDEADFQLKKEELQDNYKKVHLHKILADAFRLL